MRGNLRIALATLLIAAVIIPDPYTAQTQVAAAVAVVAEIVSTASQLNNLINGNKDLNSIKSDLAEIKAELEVMDKKLDHISAAIDALPGFITEQLNIEARRRLMSVLKTDSVQLNEWSTHPFRDSHEINAAITGLHEATENVISRKDTSPGTTYAEYNLVALAMAKQYKLLSLTKQKSTESHFKTYAEFFREASDSKVIGSLATYKNQVEAEIAAAEKCDKELVRPIVCVTQVDPAQCDVCDFDFGNTVDGTLKDGFLDKNDPVIVLNPRSGGGLNCKFGCNLNFPGRRYVKPYGVGCAAKLNTDRDAYLKQVDAGKVVSAALESVSTFGQTANKLAKEGVRSVL
jgi:hypothetical protein